MINLLQFFAVFEGIHNEFHDPHHEFESEGAKAKNVGGQGFLPLLLLLALKLLASQYRFVTKNVITALQLMNCFFLIINLVFC